MRHGHAAVTTDTRSAAAALFSYGFGLSDLVMHRRRGLDTLEGRKAQA
jgi:hypothetical protein